MSSLTTELLPHRHTEPVTSTRGRIRPLVESDLGQLAELRQWIGGQRVADSVASLKRLFFDSPWSDGEFCSVAYEDRDERLLGCLGR